MTDNKDFTVQAKTILVSLTKGTYRNRNIYTPSRKFIEEENLEEALNKLTALHQDTLRGAIPKFSDMPSGNADFMDGFRTACLQMENKLTAELEADPQQEHSNG